MSRKRRTTRITRTLSAALGFGLAAASLAAVPASTAVAAPAPSAEGTVAAYTGGSAKQQAENKAFFDSLLKKAQKRQAAQPGIQAVTVTYDDDSAPSFAYQIARSAQIWNASVDNVTLQEVSSGADFDYYEGNSQRGSYAYTDGHGHGYIVLDYRQMQVYDALRVVAHETGHVLGLPDHYSGPCSELMSGGGPGPSCTNAYPNAYESYRVDQLWAYGFAPTADKGFTKVH